MGIVHAWLWALAPALLEVPLDGRPVRFGAPLPAAAVAAGLGLEGRGVLQWRRLPIGPPDADPVWVELAIAGPPGRVRVVAGGAGPSSHGRGPAFVREQREEPLVHGRRRTTVWRWCCGAVDEQVRIEFDTALVLGGEPFAAGEALTTWNDGFVARAEVLCRLPREHFAAIGLLPPVGGAGAPARDLRRLLGRMLPRLVELPGARGAGDYGRSGAVVTNLEFDTTLALLHCAAGLADPMALARARRAAVHAVDRDVDPRSGLSFPHGPDHRTGTPEPGHVWLRGLLWVGLLAADDGLLAAAQALAGALAAHPPAGSGRQDRLRDHAWPLAEIEGLLVPAPDPVLARAADRLARSVARRFDPVARTWRFGEGEVGDGVYFERGWLLGGLLVPALRAHLQRRPDLELASQLDAVQRHLAEQAGRGGPGVPTHWRTAGGRVFAAHREVGTAAAVMLLEAFPRDELARLLQRGSVRGAVAEPLLADDPDLATTFTMVARCRWPWR